MITRIILLSLAIISPAFGQSKKAVAAYQPQEGDIAFQSLSNSWGVDLVDAIGPVQEILLAQWIDCDREMITPRDLAAALLGGRSRRMPAQHPAPEC